MDDDDDDDDWIGLQVKLALSFFLSFFCFSVFLFLSSF